MTKVCIVTVAIPPGEPSLPSTLVATYPDPREGLYAALYAMGDPVDNDTRALSLPALENYADEIAANSNTDGAVTWTFEETV
jgi:hypothetical protein